MGVSLLNFFDLKPLNTSKRALNTNHPFFWDTLYIYIYIYTFYTFIQYNIHFVFFISISYYYYYKSRNIKFYHNNKRNERNSVYQ